MSAETGVPEATRAAAAFAEYAAWPARRRRDLLHRCAAELEAGAAGLIAVVREETGLTEERLAGELTRTANQLRQLGDFVAAGRHRDDRESTGIGGVAVRAVAVPVGPVAVFAASNFPLAFGVAGGDTGSALAAGCPVVVKAHPAQPRTARSVATALSAAMAAEGAPGGTFTLLDASDSAASIALVQAPEIRAVGFTGSLGGGRALLAAAAARPDPIPVYAEMGSLNPVFVLPGAAADPGWAATLAAAVTGSAGQLCTKPGLILCPDTVDGAALADAIAAAVAAAPPHPMLTDGMAAAHASWLATARSLPGAEVAMGTGDRASALPTGDGQVPPAPFAVRVPAAALTGELLHEHFGPTVVIATGHPADYPALAAELDGSLTATVLATDADAPEAERLLPALARIAGRIVWNGVPTGVAVVEAMVHGGPWPATSAPWSTSVGMAAIQRFLRPVALQGVPPSLAATIGAE